MAGTGRRVSLADVAAAAGVGKATASRALSDSYIKDIGESTRVRIRAIAEELGYTPNRTAQALRTGRNRAIGFVVPIDYWAWWAPLIDGAATEAQSRGLQLLVHPVHHTTSLAPLIDDLRERGLDGAVVLTNDRLESQRVEQAMPVVLIDDLEPDPVLPTIRTDNREGGAALAAHLLGQGRRAPLIIAPAAERLYASERVAGFREVFHSAGIDLGADRLIVPAESADPLQTPEEEIRAAVSSFHGPIDAVFAIADYVAAGVLRALRALELDVPADVAVVGYDDERTAVLLDPALTTFRQPLQKIGASAVEALSMLLGGDAPESALQVLPGELIVRASG